MNLENPITFKNVKLTQSRILFNKEIVLSKSAHVENQILRQSGNTISHPCYSRPDNFSDKLTIKLL